MPRTLVAAAILCLAGPALAGPPSSIPKTIHYQGTLSRRDGSPLDDVLPMTFRLYEERDGGSPLWSERHPAVEVIRGRFGVELGSIEAFDSVPLLFDRPYFLSITVGDGEPMEPRVDLSAVPYALRSDEADHAGRADVADEALHAATADHCLTADHATTADNATHATTADLALNATHAVTADNATHADTADNATHASTADSATHADDADHATEADHAGEADHCADCDHATEADHAADADHATEADHALSADAANSAEADHALDADHADEADHAATADFADTTNQVLYASGVEDTRVARVTPSLRSGGAPAAGSGRYLSPKDALADVATWCPTPAADAPCLLDVAPGRYELSATLMLPSQVTIAGAGPGLTVLVADGTLAGSGQPLVTPQDHVALRALSLDGGGFDDPVLRVVLSVPTPEFDLALDRVTILGRVTLTRAAARFTESSIEADSASAALALASSGVTLERSDVSNVQAAAVSCSACTIDMQGGRLESPQHRALDDLTSSSPDVRVRIDGARVSSSSGLVFAGSDALLSDVEFSAPDVGPMTGVFIGGSASVTLVRPLSPDPDVELTLGSPGEMRIRQGTIAGTVKAGAGNVFMDGTEAGALVSQSTGNFFVARSSITSATNAPSRFTCSGVVDSDTYLALNADCQ